MNSTELNRYISVRNGELSSDEILHVIDVSRNPDINHITFENNIWNVWDCFGNYYTFRKREW